MTETKNIIQKPQSVSTAVTLIWMSLVIRLGSILLNYFNVSGVLASKELTYFFVIHGFDVILVTILIFIIVKIEEGKNWTRVVFFVIFLSKLAAWSLTFLRSNHSHREIINILFLTEAVLMAYALFLLFTQPSTSWFLTKWQGKSDITNIFSFSNDSDVKTYMVIARMSAMFFAIVLLEGSMMVHPNPSLSYLYKIVTSVAFLVFAFLPRKAYVSEFARSGVFILSLLSMILGVIKLIGDFHDPGIIIFGMIVIWLLALMAYEAHTWVRLE